jgi:hypothetical protein
MLSAFNVTTTAQVAVAPARWDFIAITNVSDTTVFAKFNGSSTALTAANGTPILPNGTLLLEDPRGQGYYENGVELIHAGSGNKEVRIQARKRAGF